MLLPSRPPRAVRIALALVLLAAPLHAQSVAGRVVEAETGEPVRGAVLRLWDANGRGVAAVLSDAEGRYRLTAPAAGTYQLRVERVGFATAAPSMVTLEAGRTLRHEVRAASRRVVLEAVESRTVRRRCSAPPRDGAVAATVWDEARKALAQAALAAESGDYWFRSQLLERHTALNGSRVHAEKTREVVTQGKPFRSASVQELVSGGYMVLGGDRLELKGVDATAILSDEFVRHHCFGLRAAGPGQPGMVGLEFVPLRGRVLPDVRGVLWLDRATAELRYVEYQYTGLRFRGPVNRLGGRMDFRRLPSGAWVLYRWLIRAPLLRSDHEAEFAMSSMRRFRMYAITEQSGKVLEIRTSDGATVPLGDDGR
ncbi:MAG TPA: carboxypeptidase-like regulatory domain-containing protein [Longimicrobium sp.]|jgi:hypothetical protein|uniref:carboxypeptidase-like regulatory domain-containing protein n=1 Tax=Longimicrobium sp. TaxID=2029185 RepID=UPI002ED8ADCE